MRPTSSTRSHIRFLTQSALLAALYVLLTYIAFALGLDKGAIQLRFSEMLCAVCAFTPAAIPGLTVGCLLSNLLIGCHPLDVVFGTLATLLGALGGYALRSLARRRGLSFLVTVPTILSNTVVVPLLLIFVYGAEDAYYFLLATVFIGELLSAGVLGTVLHLVLRRYAKPLFGVAYDTPTAKKTAKRPSGQEKKE